MITSERTAVIPAFALLAGLAFSSGGRDERERRFGDDFGTGKLEGWRVREGL